MKQSQKLRDLLMRGDTLLMPDAYDPISARIIQSCGFRAVQCSGCSIAVANCLRHESQLDLALNLEVTRKIVAAVDVPVMADGEDGYGGPDETAETIAAFVDVGIAWAMYQRALDHGAVSELHPADMDYGDRQAGVKDMAGNYWWISKRLEEKGYHD